MYEGEKKSRINENKPLTKKLIKIITKRSEINPQRNLNKILDK